MRYSNQFEVNIPEPFNSYDFESFMQDMILKYLDNLEIVYNDGWSGYSDADHLLIFRSKTTGKYYEQIGSSCPYGSDWSWSPEEISEEEALEKMEDMNKTINNI
jgi:hypothetical protein